MTPSQDVVRHRDEFALIAGRAAALGKPAGDSWPKDVRLTIDHAVDIGTQIVIRLQGNTLTKGLIVFDMGIIILLSPDGVRGRLEQVVQLFLLKLICPLFKAFHLPESWGKDESGTAGKKSHIYSDYYCFAANVMNSL